ncbi:methyltransferase domain-containing protein [Candidatus Micrarchaeota archaeon]|nr:methyltransferase domain-containing protein [Candidatus Micrarchaeota archaeon]
MHGSSGEEEKQSDPYTIDPKVVIPTRAKLLTSVDDIVRFDGESHKITKGMPIRTGSILKVPSVQYHNWGIGVTEENREELAEKADFYRKKDYLERERDPEISVIEKTPLSSGVRSSMRRTLVHLAKEYMKANDDSEREFRILDLATGGGETVSALATTLWTDPGMKELLERTSFYLVDYSGSKLERARKNLEQYHPARVDPNMKKDEDFLETTGLKFDIVFSLCHLHKKPFLDGLLKKINGVMERNGVFLSGDWHSTLCNTPEHTYNLLQRMGLDSRRLNMFRELFYDFLNLGSTPGTTREEVQGRADHQDYWVGVHQRIFSSLGEVEKARHYILGSFDTTRDRVDSMEQHGLVVDPAKIRKAFPKASFPPTPVKMMHKTDRASVIMAAKMKRRR